MRGRNFTLESMSKSPRICLAIGLSNARCCCRCSLRIRQAIIWPVQNSICRNKWKWHWLAELGLATTIISKSKKSQLPIITVNFWICYAPFGKIEFGWSDSICSAKPKHSRGSCADRNSMIWLSKSRGGKVIYTNITLFSAFFQAIIQFSSQFCPSLQKAPHRAHDVNL